jgi:hypothetical protein
LIRENSAKDDEFEFVFEAGGFEYKGEVKIF